jgi:hypothetical protein
MCGSLDFPSALVATDSFIGRWPLIGLKWSPESHCRYPDKFKKATVRPPSHRPSSENIWVQVLYL